MANERFLVSTSNTRGRAWRSALVLEMMQALQDKDLVDSFIRDDGWQIDGSLAMYNVPGFPNAHFARSGAFNFLFVGGVRNAGQGRTLWNEYLGQQSTVSITQCRNLYLDTIAARIIADCIGPVWNGAPIKMAGHSAGGAVLPYIMDRMERYGLAPGDSSCVMIGSPSPSSADFLQRYLAGDHSRWFNSEDPVPLIPFMDPVCFGATWTYSARTVTRLNNFDQFGQGYEIGLLGGVTRARVPTTANVDRTASVGGWLAQQNANVTTAHSIFVYNQRLRREVTQNPGAPALPTAPTLIAPPPITIAQANELIRNDVATIVSAAHESQNQPAVIPENQFFKAKRTGRLWQVSFGNVVIATTQNKRRARGLARMGNDFIRRLQKQEIVAAEDLTSQWEQYLFLASNPNTGFVPQLNTGFPQP